MNQRLIVFGILATCFVVGSMNLALSTAHAASAEAEGLVHRVETSEVIQERLARKLSIFGSLEAFQEIEVAAKAQGQIIRMEIEEGDRVTERQILFGLDARAEQIALARAEAELEKAEYELKKLQTGSRPEEIEEARRRLSASEAINTAAQDEWERVKELAEQGIASTSELVKARSDFDVSTAQLSQAQARFNLIEGGFRNEDILVAEAEVKVRRSQVEDIERQLEDHQILAPANGVISSRLKELGEWTADGETAIVMLVLDPMKLRVEVPQKDIASIRPGLKASVTVPGLEDRIFEGAVKTVIPQAQTGSRNFPVILELDNDERLLAAGMYAQLMLNIDEGRDVLTVPRGAIQYRGQELVVFRVDSTDKQSSKDAYEANASSEDVRRDGTVVQVRVAITRELEESVVVEANQPDLLWPGCELVVIGGSRLKDGDTVHRLENPEVVAATD